MPTQTKEQTAIKKIQKEIADEAAQILHLLALASMLAGKNKKQNK